MKGKSKFAKREIPLTERASLTLAAALDHSLPESKWAFTNDKMNKITRHYPSEQFRAVREAIGIGPECVLHSTRHTFCSRLGNAGADAFAIQKLAGHSSVTISERYVHPNMESKLSAIALLDKLNQPKSKHKPSPDGGIGRRARLRTVCRKACRFKSCSGHQYKTQGV